MDFLIPTTGHSGTFLLLCEFCEISGPSVVSVFPQQPNITQQLDDFSLRILSVDVMQGQEIESMESYLSSDSQSVVSVHELSAHAAVYSFCLFDTEARGNVRPLVLSLVSKTSNSLMIYYEEVMSHLAYLASCLRVAAAVTVISDCLDCCFSILFSITNILVSNNSDENSRIGDVKNLRKRMTFLLNFAKLNCRIFEFLHEKYDGFSALGPSLPTLEAMTSSIKFLERLATLSESRIPVKNTQDPEEFWSYFNFKGAFFSLKLPVLFTDLECFQKPISSCLRKIPELCSLFYPFVFNSTKEDVLLGPLSPPKLAQLLLPLEEIPQSVDGQLKTISDYFLIGNIIQSSSFGTSCTSSLFSSPSNTTTDKEAVSPTFALNSLDSASSSFFDIDVLSDETSVHYHSCDETTNSSPVDVPFRTTSKLPFGFQTPPERSDSFLFFSEQSLSVPHHSEMNSPKGRLTRRSSRHFLGMPSFEVPKFLSFSSSDFYRPRLHTLRNSSRIAGKLPLSDVFSLPQLCFKCNDLLHPLPALLNSGVDCRRYFATWKFYPRLVYSILIGRPLVLICSRSYLEIGFSIAHSLLPFSFLSPAQSVRYVPSLVEARKYLSSKDLAPISIVPPLTVALPITLPENERRFSISSEVCALSENKPVYISDYASTVFVDKLARASQSKSTPAHHWVADLPVYRGLEYLRDRHPETPKRTTCLLNVIKDFSTCYTCDGSFLAAVHSELSLVATKASLFISMFKPTLVLPPLLNSPRSSPTPAPGQGGFLRGLFSRGRSRSDAQRLEKRTPSSDLLSPTRDEQTHAHYSQIVDEILTVLGVPINSSDRNIVLFFALRMSLIKFPLRLDKFMVQDTSAAVYQ
ncbi:hypothetical protein RCL1_000321 [Eukaryota sp. TZLM3-RCL]